MRNAPAHISAAPAARGVQRCVPFVFNLTPCDSLFIGGHRRFGVAIYPAYSYRYL